MAAPPALTTAELKAIDDPDALLEHAYALEPSLRLSERLAVLDRIQELLDDDSTQPPPPGRSWELEMLAERAVDAAANVRLDEATALSDRVLREAAPAQTRAIARATLARGRALAWRGTEETNRQAELVLTEAAGLCGAIGLSEWQGFATFWCGYAVHYQTGNLPRADTVMREALTILGPQSPRRATVLNFHADVLAELGQWDAAAEALVQAAAAAGDDADPKSRAYVAWSLARLASARGDAFAAERRLREVERDGADWFQSHIGLAFLTDAAQLLDRVGLKDEAENYLARAVERAGDDESIRQARATLLARSGDPQEALDALQDLTRGDWLEKRLVWRHTLLTAWASFRAGRHEAGDLATRALEQAIACGGVCVAQAGEPELVAALAPVAQRSGSAPARALLLDGRALLITLFGNPKVVRPDGSEIELPAGKPGELVRMLAIHEHGLQVEMVCDAFFPEAPPTAGRQRLRQILTRLRAAAGDIVVRDGDSLRLVPAWIDLREFLSAADRVRSLRGARSIGLAYSALALWSGPLLPGDLYAEWADETRRQAEYRHLQLLDMIVSDAAGRGSHQETLTALDAALQADPYDISRYVAVAEQLMALGQYGTAQYLANQVGFELDGRTAPTGQAQEQLRDRA